MPPVHLFLMIMVVWFYDGDKAPQTITLNEPTMEYCKADMPSARAQFNDRPEVREVTTRCEDFVRGDKA